MILNTPHVQLLNSPGPIKNKLTTGNSNLRLQLNRSRCSISRQLDSQVRIARRLSCDLRPKARRAERF